MNVIDHDGAVAVFTSITQAAIAGVELLNREFDKNIASLRENMKKLGHSEAEIDAAAQFFEADRARGRRDLVELIWHKSLAAIVRLTPHREVTFRFEKPE